MSPTLSTLPLVSNPNIKPAFSAAQTTPLRFGSETKEEPDTFDKKETESAESEPKKPYFSRLADFLLFKETSFFYNPATAVVIGLAAGILFGGGPLSILTVPLALVIWPMFGGGSEKTGEAEKTGEVDETEESDGGTDSTDSIDADTEEKDAGAMIELEKLEKVHNPYTFAKPLEKSENQQNLQAALDENNPEGLPPMLKQAYLILKANEALSFDDTLTVKSLSEKAERDVTSPSQRAKSAEKSEINILIGELNALIENIDKKTQEASE